MKSDRELLDQALEMLKKFSRNSDRSFYKIPTGAGGQDSYVGCPIGMRHADSAILEIEWTLKQREKK